jgi:hypothetical protein
MRNGIADMNSSANSRRPCVRDTDLIVAKSSIRFTWHSFTRPLCNRFSEQFSGTRHVLAPLFIVRSARAEFTD